MNSDLHLYLSATISPGAYYEMLLSRRHSEKSFSHIETQYESITTGQTGSGKFLSHLMTESKVNTDVQLTRMCSWFWPRPLLD